ncbi:hypothetical protein J6590_079767 [Homalodisca vitripennis]|nr:hypothetical protein J6590_079767 [Homalodisca vitripennis]
MWTRRAFSHAGARVPANKWHFVIVECVSLVSSTHSVTSTQGLADYLTTITVRGLHEWHPDEETYRTHF